MYTLKRQSALHPRSRRIMRSLRSPLPVSCLGLCLVAAIGSALSADAQDVNQAQADQTQTDQTQAPAHIAFVDGLASLEREAQTDQAAAGMPLVPGDRLRTDSGRVEVLFPDGSALDVDEYASIDLQSPTLLRVTAGRVMLTVAGVNSPAAAIRYQIDTPVASAMTDGPGEFRVGLLSGPAGVEIELAVLRGSAALTTDRGTMRIRAGERILVRDDNEAPMQPVAFNSARFDAFDLWSAARRSARLGSSASAQYLPGDLRMYGGTLDRSGAWQYEAPHGYVWYPTVDRDWHPYYDGYWSSIRPYGWTWIGFDVWAWPTHHYGRWGLGRDRWFWIPERHWNAAWVSWGAAPGYVSWCPLGFNNRPVLGLSLTAGNSWAGWVVVPRTHFGWSNVRQWAIAPHRLPATTPFVVQARAPVATPMRSLPRPNGMVSLPAARIAVPRAAAPAGSQQSAVGIREPGAGMRQLPADRQPPPPGRQLPTAANQFPPVQSRPVAVPRQPIAIEGAAQAASGPPPTPPPPQPFQAWGTGPRTAVPRTEPSPSSGVPAHGDHPPQPVSVPPQAVRRVPAPPAPATAVPRNGLPAASASGASPRSSSGTGAGETAPGGGARRR
jgi:hypothetical protein